MKRDPVNVPLPPNELKNAKKVKEDPKDVEMRAAENGIDEPEEPKKDADLLTLEGKLCRSLFIQQSISQLDGKKCKFLCVYNKYHAQ